MWQNQRIRHRAVALHIPRLGSVYFNYTRKFLVIHFNNCNKNKAKMFKNYRDIHLTNMKRLTLFFHFYGAPLTTLFSWDYILRFHLSLNPVNYKFELTNMLALGYTSNFIYADDVYTAIFLVSACMYLRTWNVQSYDLFNGMIKLDKH